MDEILIKYLSGEAEMAEKQQILEWLKKSELNKKTFSGMRDAWLTSGLLPVSGKELQSAFNRFKAKVLHNRVEKKTIRLFLQIAASIAVLLLCSLGGYFIGKTTLIASDPVVMNQVIMANGSKGSITLPDGTVAWLNENSYLIYPETFSSDGRKVRLEGEAFFDVTPDARSPFRVETGQVTVRVLGTRFNVKNYPNRDYLETVLLSGEVEVSFTGNKETLILKPNQSVSFDKSSGVYTVNKVIADDYIVWINEKLVFTNEKLSTILSKMEKWYNVDIQCAPKVALDLRLSLTIRKEPVDEIFKILELIAPIKSRIKENKIYIQPE
jgi:ferric-dicitrate binding protein FerR (iron transport regulator)